MYTALCVHPFPYCVQTHENLYSLFGLLYMAPKVGMDMSDQYCAELVPPISYIYTTISYNLISEPPYVVRITMSRQSLVSSLRILEMSVTCN